MRTPVHIAIACAGATLVAIASPRDLLAQQADSTQRPDSITIAAGTRYRANALHHWFMGSSNRDLWLKPIRVPVLDIRTYAGGLHPTKEGGGLQTKSLHFDGSDGAEYAFRLSDKVVLSASEELRNSSANRVLQDHVANMNPAGAVISAPIMDASGVLHPSATLMVMGDDPNLGEFRREFAGRLGTIEEIPKVPDHGAWLGSATKIIDSPDLLKLLNADGAEHVDAAGYLTARLTDMLINDNDRHPGNWKWARLASGPKTQWEPIARDRDHAFVSYDGWADRVAAHYKPSLVSLTDRPNVDGLTEPAMLDARLLAGVDKATWDSVARALQGRITDSVIDVAVASAPDGYRSASAMLEHTLRRRRDGLVQTADEFYRKLADRVEVHGTDANDVARITRTGDGMVEVQLSSAGKTYFGRRFDRRETSEIVVYLHGGDDTAVVAGPVQSNIRLRVVGGNGTNLLVDSAGGHDNRAARLYDKGTVTGVTYGPDTMFDRRPWEKKDGVLVPHERDFGTSVVPLGGFGLHRTLGFTPRLGLARYTYGFNDRPYASMLSLQGEYAAGYGGFRVIGAGDHRMESSPWHFTAAARATDIETVDFFGYGNATPDSGSQSKFFQVRETQYIVRPAVALAVGPSLDLSLGPVFQHATTDTTRSPFVATTNPYGTGSFNEAGIQFGALYEWHYVPSKKEHTHHRVFAEFTGSYYPAAMDVQSAFGRIGLRAGVSTTLPVPTMPLLVVRGGAARLYGTFPFFEAATIGGEGTTRYMDLQRYTGDEALYASSELRIPLVRFTLLAPLRAGIAGVAEAGRVYVNGSSPGGWHGRTGEGFWIGIAEMSSVLTLIRTTEPGHGGLQLRLGLNF